MITFCIKFRAGFFAVRFELSFGRSVVMSFYFYFYAKCIHFLCIQKRACRVITTVVCSSEANGV